MRKSSLFQSTDLDHCHGVQAPNVVSFSEAQRARMTEAQKHASYVGAPPKKSRYAPLKDGTYAIATIKLARQKTEVPGELGSPMLRESKGARWIDATFVLEGRYNNRRIQHRFMLAAKSEFTKLEVAKTRRMLDAIFACHGIASGTGLSAIEGLRVPVELFQYDRHGDEKTVNGVHVLCPIPGHPSSIAYEKFGRTRQVKMVDDVARLSDGTERKFKKKWIDFPGWQLHPFTSLAQLLQKRLDTHEERVERNVERAVEKLAGRR